MVSYKLLAELARAAGSGGGREERAEAVARLLASAGYTCAVRTWRGDEAQTLAAAGPAVASVMRPEPAAMLQPVRHAEAVRLTDLASNDATGLDEAWLQQVVAVGLRSLLLVPLAPNGQVEAALALYSIESGAWDDLEPPQLELLGQLAAHSLGPAQRAADRGPAAGLTGVFREAVVALHVDHNVDDICRRAVEHTRRVVDADWVLVARQDPEHGAFDCHLPVERLSLLPGDSPVLSRVATLRSVVENPAEGSGDDQLVERLAAAGVQSSLALPLVFEGRSFGALQIGFRSPAGVTASVREVVEQLAFHLALALRDADLLKDQGAAVTQLRQAQQEALQNAKFRALAQMAGGVAHEFNNALGGILARAQMLQRQTQDRRLLKGLSTISEIGWRAAETVRRLQEFTRERSEEDFETITVATLWQRLSEAVRQQVAAFAKTAGVRYHVELDGEELDGVLLASADELIEAVGGVVCNALEAMPGGGVVMLLAKTNESQIYLTVVDRGTGMTPEQLQSCFDPFFSSKAETGVGLGLSVTYGIISRHRGEIEVDSQLGEGTTVSITLPLLGRRPELRTKAPHVLVIDDEGPLCDVLCELFTTQGYTVDSCAGGREGIEKYQTTHFDLVCTDLRTEDLSGWEVIRAVKESGRGTPVMLLTGFREQLRPDQIDESGVDLVLGKPFTLQQVQDAAAKLLAEEL